MRFRLIPHDAPCNQWTTLTPTSCVLHGLQRGAAADPLFVQHRLFNRPLQRAVQAAAKRFQAAVLERALSQAAAIDRAIKGVGNGDAWQGFITLGLKLTDGSKA